MAEQKPSAKVLESVCRLWGITGSLVFVRKVENWIYQAREDQLFIRVTDPEHRSPEAIKSELDWLGYLYKQGIHFAHPVLSQAQDYVEVVSDETNFSVSVFKEAVGKRLECPEDYTIDVFHNWGKTIGRLHKATKSYQPSKEVKPRPQWDEDGNHINLLSRAKSEDGAVYREVQRLMELFSQLSKDTEEYGLIHADLHRGNFHVNAQNEIIPFDFDDALYHWFIYDIAVVYFYLEKSDFHQSWQEFENYFWQGYESQNHLDEHWKKHLPDFINYRAVMMYYWSVNNLENPLMGEKAKEWMREKIHSIRQRLEKEEQ